jgi:hypothetical protein
MGNGITNPLLIKTTDGYYVVKINGTDHGPRILINELICYKLAKLMDIPIPDAALISIDQTMLDLNPELRSLGTLPGMHFGSKLVPRIQVPISEPMLKLVHNKEDIPSIILFDQIIYNDDRTLNPGNLLIDTKERKILAVDHSHPFKTGTLWDEGELKKIHNEELCLVKDFHGLNYRFLLKYVNGHNPFYKILQRISGISKESFDLCFEDIPEEWELTKNDKDALKSFIWYRIENVANFLALLREECHDWKGGESLGS